MRRIFKSELPVDDKWHELEIGSGVVHVDHHREAVALWYTDQDDSVPTMAEFRVFGTGHEIPHDAVYVGTCVDRGRGLVWHVFTR